MASYYTLQPGLKNINSDLLMKECPGSSVFPLPQNVNQNYCCRPNNIDYGRSPYLYGKGPSAELIHVYNSMRPQSTTQFNKVLVKPFERNMFPLNDYSCIPQQGSVKTPNSTRADQFNAVFNSRFCRR